jgi:hypothetical protein
MFCSNGFNIKQIWYQIFGCFACFLYHLCLVATWPYTNPILQNNLNQSLFGLPCKSWLVFVDFQNKGQRRHTVGVLLVIVWDFTSCAWALSLHTCTYMATHPSIIASRKETSSSFHRRLLKIYW